jgi:hypothetical protein
MSDSKAAWYNALCASQIRMQNHKVELDTKKPVITLPHAEWLVAEQVMIARPAKHGYSIDAPLSRREKVSICR